MSDQPRTSRITSPHPPRTRRSLVTLLTSLLLGRALGAPNPVAAKKCKRGRRRCAGRCIAKASCCTDAQCSSHQVCVDGQCRSLPCATNAGCADTHLCWAFICVDAGGPCPTDGDCPYGQICREGACSGGGLCFLDENCVLPQRCVDGVCAGDQG